LRPRRSKGERSSGGAGHGRSEHRERADSAVGSSWSAPMVEDHGRSRSCPRRTSRETVSRSDVARVW
jgi:hypothetical protein